MPQKEGQSAAFGPWMHVSRRNYKPTLNLDTADDLEIDGAIADSSQTVGITHDSLRVEEVSKVAARTLPTGSPRVMGMGSRVEQVVVDEAATRQGSKTVISAKVQLGRKDGEPSSGKALVQKDVAGKTSRVRPFGVVQEVPIAVKGGSHTTIVISWDAVDVPQKSSHN